MNEGSRSKWMFRVGWGLLSLSLAMVFYSMYAEHRDSLLPLTHCVIEGNKDIVGTAVVGVSDNGRRRQVLYTGKDLDDVMKAKERLCVF